MASHLILLADDFERRGMSPEEARLAAQRAYDGVEQAKQALFLAKMQSGGKMSLVHRRR